MPLEIGGFRIDPGQRLTIDVPVSSLSTHTPMTMPVRVICGRRPGPVVFVCAAIHGDEIVGVEVIRRLLRTRAIGRLRGTLITVPIVNVYGFIAQSRYLPDRRDLNRSFPGSPHGSLSSRLAHTFVTEIVSKCTHGIDLHTGAIHRANLPQIRANLDDEETLRLARAFGAPVIINVSEREGTVRKAAVEHGVKMLLYEAGEALRFDEISIRAGVRGVTNVLRALGMLPAARRPGHRFEPAIARSSSWVRAPMSGVLNARTRLGARVHRNQPLGSIVDPLGEAELSLFAYEDGVVIGRTNLPVIQEGDALFHIAGFRGTKVTAVALEAFEAQYQQTESALLGP